MKSKKKPKVSGTDHNLDELTRLVYWILFEHKGFLRRYEGRKYGPAKALASWSKRIIKKIDALHVELKAVTEAE